MTGAEWVYCRNCGGEGWLESLPEGESDCPACNATGRDYDPPIKKKGGSPEQGGTCAGCCVGCGEYATLRADGSNLGIDCRCGSKPPVSRRLAVAEGQETACLYCERTCERCGYPIEGGFEHAEQPQPEGSRHVVCSLRRVVRPLVENLTMFLDHQRHTAHKPAPAP